MEIAGFRVTSLARTAVDLGCTLPLDQSVAVGDVAVRRMMTADPINEVLGRLAGTASAGPGAPLPVRRSERECR